MNDKFEKLIRDTVIATLAEKGGDVVTSMANDILSKKVDPRTGSDSDMAGWHAIIWDRGGKTPKKVSYLEYLAHQEVTGHIKAAVTEWFADRSAALKKKIASRINAETLAKSYMKELAAIFDNGTFEVSAQVSRKEPERNYD